MQLSRALRLAALALVLLVAVARAEGEHEGEHHAHDEHDEHDEHRDEDEHHTPHEDGEHTREAIPQQVWSATMGSCAVVSMVTFIGVLLLALPAGRNLVQSPRAMSVSVGFAGGALLSAAVLLLLTESMRILMVEGMAHSEHGDDPHSADSFMWQWGVCVLGGVFLVMLVDGLVSSAVKLHDGRRTAPQSHGRITDGPRAVDTAAEVEAAEASATTATTTSAATSESAETDDKKALPLRRRARLCVAILVGDLAHNFTDGVFIATAFLACNSVLGWVVVLGTVAHELPQELSDYMVLTTTARVTPATALLCNFGAGLAVFLGALLVLTVEVSAHATALLLALGGGFYIYTALAECVPAMLNAETTAERAVSLCAFVFGATVIGLVLLNHQHCEVGHAEH